MAREQRGITAADPPRGATPGAARRRGWRRRSDLASANERRYSCAQERKGEGNSPLPWKAKCPDAGRTAGALTQVSTRQGLNISLSAVELPNAGLAPPTT